MKVQSVLVHLLVFASLSLVSCRMDTPPSPQESATAALPVSVITPSSDKVVEWDEYTGRFRASQRVEVKARVSGFLESVNFEDGAEVKQGDVFSGMLGVTLFGLIFTPVFFVMCEKLSRFRKSPTK